jgi:hypothetical protein
LGHWRLFGLESLGSTHWFERHADRLRRHLPCDIRPISLEFGQAQFLLSYNRKAGQIEVRRHCSPGQFVGDTGADLTYDDLAERLKKRGFAATIESNHCPAG